MESGTVSIARTDIEVLPAARGYRLSVEHRLDVVGGESQRPVVMELAQCPFVLYDVSCSASFRPTQIGDRLQLQLRPGSRWEDATIRYVVQWDRSRPDLPIGQSRFLRFPEMLPALMPVPATPGRAAVPQQTVHLIRDELAVGLHVTELQVTETDAPVLSDGALQVVLCEEESVVLRNAPATGAVGVALSATIEAAIGAEASAELILTCGRVLDRLQGILGAIERTSVVVVAETDQASGLRGSGGVCLLLGESDLARYPVGSPGLEFELTREFASIWWGAGSRLTGRMAFELEAALGAGVALAIFREAGSSTLEEIADEYSRVARRRAPLAFLPGVSRRGRERLAAKTALTIFESLQYHERRLALQGVTSDFWGLHIPTPVCVRLLRNAGFDLPQSLAPSKA